MRRLLPCLICGAAMMLTSATLAATATPDAAPTPSPKPSPATSGTAALVIDDHGAQTVLGLPVQTSKGEDLGHVVDVVCDRGGAMLAAIVDFGGFLGVGSRKIAVDWRILHFPKTDAMTKLVADLPLDQLRNAPVYKPGEPIVIMGVAPKAEPTATPAPPADTPAIKSTP